MTTLRIGACARLGALAALATIFVGPVAAGAPAPSGFELALHGSTDVYAGRAARLRGSVYRVHGLAELTALGGARVRARVVAPAGGAPAGAWREARADQRGLFQVEVDVPELRTRARLEVTVGDEHAERRFGFDLRVRPAFSLDLRTDRVLYEPGEAIHVWARLRDAQTGRPLPGQRIVLTVPGTAVREWAVVTDASGVGALAAGIPRAEAEGSHQLTARVAGETIEAAYRIGTRALERLFVTVRLSPETAAPHGQVRVTIAVTTPGGAPVPGATVSLTLDGAAAGRATTDGQGLAVLEVRAPAYLQHDTGLVALKAEVTHPAHGAAVGHQSLRLAVPLALQVEAIAPNGGLVPEVDGRLFIVVRDPGRDAAPAGTSVEVRGAAIRDGRQLVRTDGHGIAVVATRLAPVAAAAEATVAVRAGGAAARTVWLKVPVRLGAEVVPAVARPVVSPGEDIAVSLARRPSAARLPVVVELLGDGGLVQALTAEAGAKSVVLRAPADRLGVFQVRARPIRARGVVEGTGGMDALIVRPSRPSFPKLTVQPDPATVRSTVRLTLATPPGAARSWAAVLVRDLTAHTGERPFALAFLGAQFDRAVLDPTAAAAETLLRTALAAHVPADGVPGEAPQLLDELGRPREPQRGLEASRDRGTLRDPFPLADELRRRGVGRAMVALERLLADALEHGRLSEITTGTGTARRFRPEALTELEHLPRALGDGALTLEMIEAADPSFRYEAVARRVARARLVKLLAALARFLDPKDDTSPQERTAAREPPARWLGRMVQRGLLQA
ncbi:MAG TPA: hypothetical protein VGQ83_24570, partial [Polyangia bacterium]